MLKRLYEYLNTKFFRFQLMRFAFVGGTAAIIDFGLLILLTEGVHIYYLLSATISYIVSNLYNFVLSKRWTFQNASSKVGRQYVAFIIIGVIGLGINNAIIYASVEHVGLHYLIGKVIAAAVVMIWNYFMNKHVTFRLVEKI